jgi:hypothetical protein
MRAAWNAALENTTAAAQPAVQAELDAASSQEPIGEIRNGEAYFYNGMYTNKTDVPDGTKLYTTPPAQELQRYSPDGEGGMEVDSLGAYVKHQDVLTPTAPLRVPTMTLSQFNRELKDVLSTDDVAQAHVDHIVLVGQSGERITIVDGTFQAPAKGQPEAKPILWPAVAWNSNTADPVLRDQSSAPAIELVGYVLQDNELNRLTPRVVDIAYSAFMSGRTGKNKDDGGPCDWFNDTKPMVMEQMAKIRRDLAELTFERKKPDDTEGGEA